MKIGRVPIVVFYAKDVPQLDSNSVQDAYIVTYNGSYGLDPVMFEMHDIASIGDGIGSATDYRYYFTYANNQITTNWTAQPCTKTP